MRKILTILLLFICSISFGQDIKPISPLFKNLQSPSFSFMIGGNVWIYKGSTFNPNPWTELAGWTKVKDTINYYVPYRNAHDTLITSYPIKTPQLILDTTHVHSGLEEKGTIAWDESTQSVETHISSDLHLNNGEELWVPLCYNNSGADILNGQPVYINSASGSDPTIRLASNITYDESRLIGVATQNIPNGSKGRVTRFGYVNDIDLSSCTSGSNVYLGDKALTHIRPTGGTFPVVVGKAIVCTTTGRLLVYPQGVEYTSEVNKVDGWPSYLQGEQTNISFSNLTRTLFIAPVGSSYYFYQVGVKYIKTITDSFQITDVEGLHYVYYNNGVLTEQVNPSASQITDIIRNYISVSVIYWDATNKVAIYIGNERHTFHWPFWVRAFIHTSFWTQYLSGLGLTNITLGSGALNADAQFGVDAGSIADEDIISSTPSISSTTGLPIYYRSGSGVWRKTSRAGYSFLNDGTTGLAQYNLFSGGTWSLVSMTNNYYRLVHVFANNDLTSNVFCVSGIAQYAAATDAENGINAEINNIYSGALPFAEAKYIGCLILHTKTGLGNSVNARFVAIPSTGTAYKDFRKAAIQGYGGGGSGSLTFLGLSDTPDSYAGQANKLVGVTNLETGVEFKPVTIDGTTGVVNIPSGATYNKGGVPIISQAIDGSTTTLTASQKAIKDYADTKEPLLTKGNLTESIPGLEFTFPRQVIGGATDLKLSTGYSLPSTASQTTWDEAYNKKVNSISVTGTNTKTITLSYQDGSTSTATFTNISSESSNSYIGKVDVTNSTISVLWPTAFSSNNYKLITDVYYIENINGKSVRIKNAVYDYNKDVTGFSLKVDTIAGYVEYFAFDTINISPTSPVGNVDVFNSTPSGSVDGSNKTFTLLNTPILDTERLTLNGLRQYKPTDYSISSGSIIFVSAPLTGDIIKCDYRTFQGSLVQTDYFNQSLTGVKNGINKTFTVANPIQTSSSQLFLNGVKQILNTDYTVNVNTIEFTTAPISTDLIIIDYRIQ